MAELTWTLIGGSYLEFFGLILQSPHHFPTYTPQFQIVEVDEEEDSVPHLQDLPQCQGRQSSYP